MTPVTCKSVLLLLCAPFLIISFVGCDGDGDNGGTVVVAPPAGGQAAEAAIDVTGTWSGDVQLPNGPSGVTLQLTQNGTSVTGDGGYTGTLTGNRLILTRDAITFDMTVSGNTMTGTYSDSSWNDRPVTLTR